MDSSAALTFLRLISLSPLCSSLVLSLFPPHFLNLMALDN